MEIITYVLLFISLFFEVFLLVSFLEKRVERRNAARPTGVPRNFPSVAIVVPCFNEEKGVVSTLTSLMRLTYPAGKFEILVVDDGSTDNTLATAQAFAVSTPENRERIRIFSKANGGKYSAMNLALSKTSAELIGCLDADSIVEKDALLRIVRAFENPRVAAVTPGIHVRKPETLLQHLQTVEYRLSIFNRFMLAALGSAFIAPGPFSVFRASVVRELGGWRHGHSTEDMELALRIQSAGHLIANAPAAVVHTTTPRTIRALFRQRTRWTYGFLKNAVDYRHMLANRSYGNLGIIVLPLALFSVGTGIYFFMRLMLGGIERTLSIFAQTELTGVFPHPSVQLFYVNTSAMLFLVYFAIALILVLISAGSLIGTGKRMPPLGTPLFLAFYCFLAPLWLSAAVVRAIFNTGVRWR